MHIHSRKRKEEIEETLGNDRESTLWATTTRQTFAMQNLISLGFHVVIIICLFIYFFTKEIDKYSHHL